MAKERDGRERRRRQSAAGALACALLSAVLTAQEALPGAAVRDRSRLLTGVGSPLEVYQIPEAAGADFTDAHSYLVCDRPGGEALLVDAGSHSAPLALARAASLGVRVALLVSTHFHADHTGGNATVLARTSARMVAPAREAGLLTGEELTAGDRKALLTATTPRVDVKARQGDEIKLGARVFKVIEIPGHSPGGICLYFQEGKLLFSGDSLLKGGIGRVGMPRAAKTPEAMVAAIRSKLLSLPDDTTVLPGHGPPTTIGAERAANPWLKPPPKKPEVKPEKSGAKPDPKAKKR